LGNPRCLDDGTFPDFGAYDYDGILDAFAQEGFIVISQVRRGDMGKAAVDWTVEQVEHLVATGVRPDRITVVGFSKGGGITLEAARRAQLDAVNYVILAGCSTNAEWVRRVSDGLRGRILSMYDRSDRFAPSCRALFAAAEELRETEEVVLELGLDHGLFYRPREEWMSRIRSWARSPEKERR
jgi:dienelactone hydrolase